MADLIPILSSLSKSVSLLEKLYIMMKNHAQNKLLVEQVRNKIKIIHFNVEMFSKDSDITNRHSRIAKGLQEETRRVNDSIESLIPKLEKRKRKVLSFLFSGAVNTDLRGLLQSAVALENAVNIFGLCTDIRKEQASHITISNEMLESHKRIVPFLQMHNVRKDIDASNSHQSTRINYEDVENEQIEVFSQIPTLVQEIKSSQLPKSYKDQLILALENSEKSWKYTRNDFTIEKIGDEPVVISSSGGFKQVYKGKLEMSRLDNNEETFPVPVAVLEYPLVGEDLERLKGRLLREIYLSWQFDHPCIVKTFGAFWPNQMERGLKPKMFSELMTENLRNALGKPALKGRMTRYSIAIDVAEGLSYLHENGFVHRDIKPENVLLRIKDDALVSRAKICDFGASKEVLMSTCHQSVQFTPIFAPPEEFSLDGVNTTFEYDLWGFGLILCWLDGDEAMQIKAIPAKVELLARQGLLMQMTRAWVCTIKNEILRKCAEQCINEDPGKRGTISGLLPQLKLAYSSILFEKGLKLYNKKMYTDALEMFKKATEQGNPNALDCLATCYHHGQGTETSLECAAKFYKRAANLGNLNSMYRLGLLLLQGVGTERDLTEAATTLKRAADQGHVEAQEILVSLHNRDMRTQIDEELKRAKKRLFQVTDELYLPIDTLIDQRGKISAILDAINNVQEFKSTESAQSSRMKPRQGLIGRVLESIYNAEEVFGRGKIRFPRIALFGDEGTGKSSLMEAICGVPFPRGKHGTTRVATQVRLFRTDAPWSAKAWTEGHHDSMSEKCDQVEVSSPEKLTAVIKTLQEKDIQYGKDTGSNSTFTARSIIIEIRAPEIDNLIMVDVPGYFQQSDMENNDNVNYDVEDVKQMVEDYLKQESTILLIAIKATADLKNVSILNLIEEYKATLSAEEERKLMERTMYCFTMCDHRKPSGKIAAPRDMEEILLNRNERWKAEPHGWYAVANNVSEPKIVSEMCRFKSAMLEEAKFFANYEPYTHTKIKDRCGTQNVIAKLTSVLADSVSEDIDNIRAESEETLQSLRALVEEEQAFVWNSRRNYRSEFDAIVCDLRRYFTEAGNGEYGAFKEVAETIITEDMTEILENCELGRKAHERCERFKTDIQMSRIDSTSEEYLQDLHRKVITAEDGRMDKILMDKNVAMYEVRSNAKKWKALADALYDDIAQLAEYCLHIIVRVCSAKYKTLSRVLLCHLTSLIDEQKEKALTRLRWHYTDEILRPITLIDGFVESYSEKKRAGLGASNGQNSNTSTEALEAYLPAAEARFIDNAVRTIMTHILDVPLGNRETRFDKKPKFMFTPEAIRDGRDLEELMSFNEDLYEKHDQISAEVERLENLRNAFIAIKAPTKIVEDFDLSEQTNSN